MVGKYEVSADGLTYTFTLRDGLKFHDGTPVTPRTCVASLKRWGAKDGVGQRMMGYVDEMEAVDDKTFTMTCKEPYGMVLESLGKRGSSIAAIMRETDALTDPSSRSRKRRLRAPSSSPRTNGCRAARRSTQEPDYVGRATSRRRPSPAARCRASTASSWSGSPIRRPRWRR